MYWENWEIIQFRIEEISKNIKDPKAVMVWECDSWSNWSNYFIVSLLQFQEKIEGIDCLPDVTLSIK